MKFEIQITPQTQINDNGTGSMGISLTTFSDGDNEHIRLRSSPFEGLSKASARARRDAMIDGMKLLAETLNEHTEVLLYINDEEVF